MSMERSFTPTERNMDTPDIPDFFFSEKEKQAKRKKGMTNEQINEEETAIRNKVAQAKFTKKKKKTTIE